MNTKVGDSYIFSGTKSDTAPYADATGDAYQGDGGALLRDGGAGVVLQTNPSFVPVGGGASVPLTADAILGNGSAAGDGRVLDALTQLTAHLRGGTTADLQAIQGTDLQAIKANQTAVSSAISGIGAMSNRATAAASRLDDLDRCGHAEHRRPHRRRHGQGHHRLLRPVCRLPGLPEGRRADHPAVPTPVPLMSSGLNNPNNGGDSTMAVTLQSSRFGELQIPEEAVLDFPNGLIGLGGRRFALLARSDESAFVWLHSMDDPDLAVPVTNPWRFFEDYELELSDDEAERIGVSDPGGRLGLRDGPVRRRARGLLRQPARADPGRRQRRAPGDQPGARRPCPRSAVRRAPGGAFD